MNMPSRIGRNVFFVLASLLILAPPALADISSVSVAVSPSTVNTNAQYTLSFTTGSSGALATTDTIIAVFPANTTLDNFPGGAGGQVTVNGTTATATAAGQTLTISVPRSDIGNNTSVTVIITTGTDNLVNPSIAGTSYRVTMSTSVEPNGVNSSTYSITLSGTTVNIDSVTPNPTTIGNWASYDIQFDLAADGDLWGYASTITVVFPSDTLVQNGAISGITIEGVAAASATGTAASRTIVITPSTSIAGGTSNRNIIIPSTALRNPTSVNTYTLTVATSAQPAGTSPNYSIGLLGTAINVDSATPSPNTIANLSSYDIQFDIGATGGLAAHASTITIVFPSDTIVQNGAISGVTIDGVAAGSATGTAASRTIVVTPATDIAGGTTNINVVIPASALRNPTTAASYNLTVDTSVQNQDTSPNYTITTSGTSVAIDFASPTPATIGNPAQYDIQFDLASDGGLFGCNSTITIVFPSDTVVQNGAIAGVTVEGVAAASATGTAASRTIVVTPAQSLNGGTGNVNVVIPAASLRNPTTVSSLYTLTVDTSVQNQGISPTYSIGTSSTPVTAGTVTPNPNTVGNPSQYTVLFNTASDGALVANTSTITIVFPSNTAVQNGAIGGITVQGIAAFSATGNSGTRTIVVTTGTNVAGSTNNVSVVIPSTALTNPTTPNTYTLTVATSVQLTAGTSPGYTIAGSSTPVTVVSVTPNPTTIGNYAQYTIDFSISSDGALVGGSSTITVAFPVGTVVAGGAIANVTVEGLAATSATGDAGARTITITPQQSFSGGTANITIVIPSTGSAVRNPTTAANYTLTVATSVQPAGTSPNYAINTSGTAVTVVSAAASPNTIGNIAQYTIDFNTASNGALVGGVSTITVTFPAGTAVANGAIANVTVEGTGASSATGNSGARTITITPAQDIAASTSNVTIFIPSAGGAVRNPLIANSYTLTVATSVQPTAGTSPSYTIGLSGTSVNIDSVLTTPATIGNQSSYNIQFDLASDGGLVGSASTITIVFPSDTVVQNGAIAGVTVEGVAAASATGTAASRTIVITPANTNLTGGFANVNVIIPSTALRNPTTAASYTLTVATSVQPAGTSPSYTIGLSSTAVVITSVNPSPNTISQPASYTVDFNTASDGALIGGTSQIVVTFPSDTAIGNGAIPGTTVEGLAATSATGNSGARTITIVPAQNLAGGTTNITLFMPSSRINNPTSAGNYQLTVSTSVQPAGTSPQYVIGISSTSVNVDSVSASPAVIGNPALYTIQFDVSTDGGLTGGVSTITVTFPSDTFVTNGVLAGITVNGTGATSATGNSGARTIAIIPSQDLPGGTANVVLSIPTTAVRNPTTTGNKTLTVATSLQPAGTSPQYSITTSGTALAVGSVTVSPNVVGNQASYQFDFNTASDGYLIGGTSQIVITFPSDTNVPNGAIGSVTVEGTGATSATGNTAARTITIVPTQNITGGTNGLTVFIPSAGVRNPTSTGTYTLTAYTSPQISAGTSPNYTIGQSATPVTIVSVVPSPSTIGNQGQYTINFNTAADGALVGNASHILITFPNDSVVTNGAIGGVTVEGSAAFSAIGSAASRTIDIVPSNNIAGSFTNVTVVIPASAVRNPTTAANYTLTLSTSPQPVGTSPAYAIGQSSTLVNVTAVVPNPTTIGNQSQYTIDFNTSSDGALLGTVSQIIVTFPSDTVVQNGALAGVTVEGVAASSATGNSGTRTVTIVPSQNISGGASSVTLLIPSTILRNPTTINTYTLTVATTVQPAGTSPGYSIGQSGTVVNVSAVTPAPATIGNPAQYTIAFTTSPDGALLASTSTITLVFPSNTAVQNGPISGITVNGAAPTSATGNSGARSIVMTISTAIAASTAVTVVVPSSALTNPTTAGNYQMTVATSVQPAGNSPLYGIGLSATPISVTSVTPAPAVVGNLAAYTVVFNTSADGAIPAGTGSVIITFPLDTLVPNGALANITINGAPPTTATGDTGNRRITLVPSANIGASSTVTVVVPLSVGLRNPTTTGSTFTLSVASSAQPAGTSPQYAITQSATAVAITSVTPNPTTVGSNAQYTVLFSTSADGPLYNGISRIYLTFPSNTYVTTGAISGVTVNGTPATATGDGATRVVNILIGANISASTAVTVVIPSADLHNPTNAGNYTLTVSTTAQPAGTSPSYAITISSTPVTVTLVTPTSNNVNTLAGYSVYFTTAVVLRGGASRVFLVFPPSTDVPNGAIAGVTIGGPPATSAIGDTASRTIVVVPSGDVAPGATDTIIPNPVILNPSIPGSVPMNVSTTAQPTGTLNYPINPSSSVITTPSVVPNPSRAGEIAEYAISFSVGAHGRLAGGNTISVLFPAGTTFPSGIPAGSITVNGTGNTGTHYAVGNFVHVLVPPGVNIANNGAVSLVFTTAALIRNPGQGGARLDDVHTDAEPTPVPSNFYVITADSQIEAPTVTPNPNALGANAEYTVVFRLGTSGSLDAGVDHIYVVFNNATTLPLSVSNPSLITVNGTPATAVAKITNGFDIRSPIDMAAGAPDKTITIIFRTGIGIYNPSLPGDYTLQAYTTIENTPITSNPYTIAPSTSTRITQPVLELSPAFINSYARYHITFNTGALGGLTTGVSSIDIVFPAEFALPSAIAAENILVNNTALTAVPAISGQTLTLTVPVTIAQSGAVDIVILSTSQIRNPSMVGTYALTLSTSSEPTPVESTAVTIRPSTWTDVVGYPNPLKWDESANKSFTFLFIPDQTVTLRLYTLDGKLVKTITKNDNTDRIVWNVDNERGRTVASGIYLYVIKGTTGEKRGKIGFLK